MISRIDGVLEDLSEGVAHVRPEGGLTYELLVPAYASSRLGQQIGRPVTLHTVHFLEGAAQSNNLIPRLAGFVTAGDREFFELFRSVKGIGARKALRAMSLSTGRIAEAIADRDVKTLQALPEIGKRTAETIVAALHGKVDRFVRGEALAAGTGAAAEDGQAAPAEEGATEQPTARSRAAREALEVLVQLGENRAEAIGWIDEALTADPELTDSEQIITRVLQSR